MAEEKKAEGNALFGAGQWLKAAGAYTQAIKLDPENAALYSNRSAALLKLLKVTKAMEDAEQCIKLKPEWEKGYFRKGAILEEQQKMSEAMELYQHALQLVPDSRELSLKVQALRKKISKAGLAGGSAAGAAAAGGGSSNGKGAAGGGGGKGAGAANGSGGSGSGSTSGAKAKEGSKGPAPSKGSAGDVVYEDLGSVEVAAFAEEYLSVLRDEIKEGSVIPTVHFLPGRALPADEEQQAHVRCAGGFESPETLQGLVAFLRSGAEKLSAQAVLTFTPKSQISYPRTWEKPKWPGGDGPGVFAQLEASARKVQKLWFIPLTPASPAMALDFDTFAVMPPILRG